MHRRSIFSSNDLWKGRMALSKSASLEILNDETNTRTLFVLYLSVAITKSLFLAVRKQRVILTNIWFKYHVLCEIKENRFEMEI